MFCALSGAFIVHSAALPEAVDQQSPLLKLEAKIIGKYPVDIKLIDKHFGICAELQCNVKFINAVVEHKIFEEKKMSNSFKFSDIFNDLSLHTFKFQENIDKNIWQMPRPVYDEADVEFISKNII